MTNDLTAAAHLKSLKSIDGSETNEVTDHLKHIISYYGVEIKTKTKTKKTKFGSFLQPK